MAHVSIAGPAESLQSAYLPSMQVLPGITNQQVYQGQRYNELVAQGYNPVAFFAHPHPAAASFRAQPSISDAHCTTAVEGREVAGKQVGNGTFDAKEARAAVYSAHYDAFYSK